VYPSAYGAPDYEIDEGVQVWRIREGAVRLAWVQARYRLYRLIRGWIRQGAIDYVESPDCHGWFAGWPSLPVPLVLRAHGAMSYYAHELGQTVDRTSFRLESWSHRRADGWTAVSRHAGEVTRRVFGLPRGPDRVLYNPVPVPEAVTPYEGRVAGQVVYTGTLTPKKGILSLLEAWPAILRAHPSASLQVFGKGKLNPGGRSTAEELLDRLPSGVRSTVVFRGHVDRPLVLQALAKAKVAVFPSYTETFGFCAAEAMAAACPTVYTTLSCGPEIVRDGIDGLGADPRAPAALAGAVNRILGDDQLGRRLGAGGRARVVRDFSVESVIPANEAFFADMIGAFRSRQRRSA
jgi:glycosyltransferase involved in cell wall biosynthesis